MNGGSVGISQLGTQSMALYEATKLYLLHAVGRGLGAERLRLSLGLGLGVA